MSVTGEIIAIGAVVVAMCAAVLLGLFWDELRGIMGRKEKRAEPPPLPKEERAVTVQIDNMPEVIEMNRKLSGQVEALVALNLDLVKVVGGMRDELAAVNSKLAKRQKLTLVLRGGQRAEGEV
jgi:hypothetical protein